MIRFFGTSESTGEAFDLDVTHLNITFVDESALFYDYFLKGYSMPFSFNVDSDFAKKMDFLEDFNAVNYKTEIKGTLQIDGEFDIAVLKLKRLRGSKIEGTFYYGRQSFPLMSVKLSDLGWALVDTEGGLRNFAQDTIGKSYPEVDFNFPTVYHPQFSSDHYEEFLGFLNYHTGQFKTNQYVSQDGESVPYNYNAMVPMAYVVAVLKKGFALENYTVLGDFITHPVAHKLILFSEKHLVKYQSSLPDNFQLTAGSEVWDNNYTTATFTINQTISIAGTYTIFSKLELQNQYEFFDLRISYGDEELLHANGNLTETFTMNVPSDEVGGLFRIQLILKEFGPSNTLIGSIEGQNLFRVEFLGGDLNIYPNVFSLSEIMPDITFGTFLNKLKNFFNLEIILDQNKAIIDFVEDNFTNKVVYDESDFEVERPERLFKKKHLYQLKSGINKVLVGPEGQVYSQEGYAENEIITIDSECEMMPVESTDLGFTAVKKESSTSFQLLIYDGLQSNRPVSVEAVSGFYFSIQQVYDLYWKKWLHFRLNAEVFKDRFKSNIFGGFDIEKLRYKYQRKHVYKKIKRTRKGPETWEYEIESETL